MKRDDRVILQDHLHELRGDPRFEAPPPSEGGPTVEEYREIQALVEAGHTHHCGARQVWGDGECECISRHRAGREGA